MKVIVVGATGTIGQAVVKALENKHEVIKASRRGVVQVDLNDPASLIAMYEKVGKFDAVISTAGSGKFGPLNSLTDEDFEFGLGNKLMGQVNLVRLGQKYINDGGSFTLTSGILTTHPNPNSVLITTLNSAVEGFVRSAGLNMERGIRLNAVSPPMVAETAAKMGWGLGGVPADEVAKLYLSTLEGQANGAIIPARPF